MCTGIALSRQEVPARLAGQIATHLYVRASREEYQFHWWQTPTLLPVHWNGGLQCVRWGSKSRRSRLPYGGWLEEEHRASLLPSGSLADVVIPASLGYERGTWFLIDMGIRGVAVRDEDGSPIVYMLMKRSTNYYRNMTQQSPLMPIFIEQVI